MAAFRIVTIIVAPIEVCFDLSRDIDFHVRTMEAIGERAVAGRTTGRLDQMETSPNTSRPVLVSSTIDVPTRGANMRLKEPTAWVVYRLPSNKEGVEMNAMCSQDEWNTMERDHPGQHVLVRDQIASETEAERLVRSLLSPDLSKSKRKR